MSCQVEWDKLLKSTCAVPVTLEEKLDAGQDFTEKSCNISVNDLHIYATVACH